MIRGNKLYINITNHCDVCCPFCCMKSDGKKQSFMHFDTIHKIMKDMDGQYIVQLEGGEPTTHPQFYLLMEYISTLECLNARQAYRQDRRNSGKEQEEDNREVILQHLP